jgi:hypothetical protein
MALGRAAELETRQQISCRTGSCLPSGYQTASTLPMNDAGRNHRVTVICLSSETEPGRRGPDLQLCGIRVPRLFEENRAAIKIDSHERFEPTTHASWPGSIT